MSDDITEEGSRKLATLDPAIERGMADTKAGRVYDLDEVCDELEAEIAALLSDPPAWAQTIGTVDRGCLQVATRAAIGIPACSARRF
jgi:hypothetical protein